jgi:hypothetical protein
MRFESISDIYSSNRRARERFLGVLDGVTDAEAIALPSDERWTVCQIAEHVAMVNQGMAGICGRLIEKAKSAGASPTDGLPISDEFYSYVAMMSKRKAEAPERVQPTGSVSLAESIERLAAAEAAVANLSTDLESLDLSVPKFPHPYFGDLTAVEWFALMGLHEHRHADQAARLLDKIRQ